MNKLRGRVILADDDIQTGELAADAVTGAKLADDSVDSEHYVDGSIDTAHYAAGSVDRTAMAEKALDVFGINLGNVRTNAGAVLGVVEAADTFYAQIGTNQLFIQGEEALSETEASIGWFEIYLPPN